MKSPKYDYNEVLLEARESLLSWASTQQAAVQAGFFKTGKGDYAEGDIFVGVRMPRLHELARKYATRMSPFDVLPLLTDPIHECRMLALLMWVRMYDLQSQTGRDYIYSQYLAHTAYINNWDLVDLSAYKIVGAHLLDKERSILYRLAHSSFLWDQRIAVVSTFAFIRQGQYDDILSIAELLLYHTHDLIHKSVGWMLREVGKRDKKVLINFLEPRYKSMPRTMLRYAIERFSPSERAYFMRK